MAKAGETWLISSGISSRTIFSPFVFCFWYWLCLKSESPLEGWLPASPKAPCFFVHISQAEREGRGVRTFALAFLTKFWDPLCFGAPYANVCPQPMTLAWEWSALTGLGRSVIEVGSLLQNLRIPMWKLRLLEREGEGLDAWEAARCSW